MIERSIIIPVFNRPDEIKELLDSLTIQNGLDDTEFIIVEDGSTIDCQEAIEPFSRQLNIRYIYQDNAGPSKARNVGAAVAQGKMLYFFDSDCTLPSRFFTKMCAELELKQYDCFGTMDCAHTFFSPIQKAISYSMTSLLTTGGIRGSKDKSMDLFYPRSYSMGIRTSVFRELGGFSEDMRYGEDIDLSLRVAEAGYSLGLIKDTFVYHRRRSTFKSFFKQTFCSGTARIDLAIRHKGAIRLVHALPTIAVLSLVTLLALSLCCSTYFLIPIGLYALLIIVDSFREFRSVGVAFLSVVASAIQICGYGLGFLYNVWQRLILHDMKKIPFQRTLYK